MSDRIVILDRGRILQSAPPRDLYERPETEFVAGFLGKSNFLRGQIGRVTDGLAEIRCGALSSWASVGHQRDLVSGSRGAAALRPEKIKLHRTEPVGDLCTARGRTTAITYLGSTVEVELVLPDDSRLTAMVPAGSISVTEGEELIASWAPDAPVLVKPREGQSA